MFYIIVIVIFVIMYITKIPTYTSTGKLSHTAVLLRRSYREKGKVKTETIANLKGMSEEEINAIQWALKNKKNIDKLQIPNVQIKQGKSIGAVYLLNELLKRLGLSQAIGNTYEGRLAKLQILSRTINQGSRLSAIRMAQEESLCEVLSIEEAINEDSLYKNLLWVSSNQREIEQKLYKKRYAKKAPELFLYDVTSSYFEGTHNELAHWGYNRDKKKGKMQLVAGLMCDEEGYPITIRLYDGNTLDFKTVHNQITKVVEDFGCQRVTIVGDRGMLKGKQIEELVENDYYYITAITKPQMEGLLKQSVLQMNLFDKDMKEVEHNGVRYILRRNDIRAEEIRRKREEKKAKIQSLCQLKNQYLREHTKAKIEIAIKEIDKKINKLGIQNWLKVENTADKARELVIKTDSEALAEASKFDGCYVIKSNLPVEVSKETIHARYKDLSKVESGFRCMKTELLELRPCYLRKAKHTEGHAFIVMMSYILIYYLKQVWQELNITVEEGLKLLSRLCLLEVTINDKEKYYRIPTTEGIVTELLQKANIKLPDVLPFKQVNVSSRQKLKRKG